jgi:hypothetical protein
VGPEAERREYCAGQLVTQRAQEAYQRVDQATGHRSEGSAGGMTGAGGTSAGGASNGSSGRSLADTTDIGDTLADGSRYGSSTLDMTDIGDTLADVNGTRGDIGVNSEVGAGVGWVPIDIMEVILTGAAGA